MRFLVRGPSTVRWGAKIYPTLDAFLAEFGADLGLPGARAGKIPKGSEWMTFGQAILDARSSGTLDEKRRADVSFEKRGKYDLLARFLVSLENGPTVTITRELLAGRIVKALGGGTPTGDAAFDRAFHVKGKDARLDAARELVRAAFERFGVEELRVGRRTIEAVVKLSAFRCPLHETAKTPAARTRELVELLGRLAASFERVPLRVSVLGGERAAFPGLGGSPRCAYCHEDVSGEDPELVACETCATVLHGACWKELGRCPVLGCPSTRTEAQRAR